MKNSGLLVILSGPSGCGKGTVIKELLRRNPNVFLSVSATTRLPREGEQDGIHYHFITKDRFESLIAEEGMLEYASYCDNYYGTPKAAVEEKLCAGKDVILEIEVQGALQVMNKRPDAVSIFILPPSAKELEHRLVGRNTEDRDTIDKRLAKAWDEITYASRYDYAVVNDDLMEAVQEIEAVLMAEKCKSVRMEHTIASILDNNC